MNQDQHPDQLTSKQLLVRTCAFVTGSLAFLGLVLYATLWFPFQHSDAVLPFRVDVLPVDAERPSDSTSDNVLSSYAWLDREAGVVRIPIEQAMHIASDTLPVAEDAPSVSARSPDRMIPTDAGSGRFVVVPRGAPSAKDPSPSKDPSPNKLPIRFPLTLPSPLLFSLREAGERLLEPVTYLRTVPNEEQGADRESAVHGAATSSE
jgi:hypothetical protein